MRFTAASYAVVDLEGDASLCAHLAAFEFQTEFQEEEFFKDEPDVRRRARRLQLGQALTDLGPVRLPEGASPLDQPHASTDHGRDRVGNVGSEALQHAVNHATKPARSDPAVAGGFVDGHDAPDLERLPLLLVHAAVTGRRRRIVQDLELRLDDFEAMAAAIASLDLAIQRERHAGAKLVLQVGGVKPNALQRVAPLADGHLEDRHAARAEQSEGAHVGDDAGHLAHAKLADAARVQAIFVAEGQVVEQVFDGCNALLQQDLRELRPDAFYELHIGSKVEHRAMVNQDRAHFRLHGRRFGENSTSARQRVRHNGRFFFAKRAN